MTCTMNNGPTRTGFAPYEKGNTEHALFSDHRNLSRCAIFRVVRKGREIMLIGFIGIGLEHVEIRIGSTIPASAWIITPQCPTTVH